MRKLDLAVILLSGMTLLGVSYKVFQQAIPQTSQPALYGNKLTERVVTIASGMDGVLDSNEERTLAQELGCFVRTDEEIRMRYKPQGGIYFQSRMRCIPSERTLQDYTQNRG